MSEANIMLDGHILQLDVIGDDLFILFENGQLEVREKSGFNLKPPISLKDIIYPRFLAADQRNNCLYIGSTKPAAIHRLDLSTGKFTPRPVIGGQQPSGLSVTKEGNVLVTLANSNIMQEYTVNGDMIEIPLLDSSKGPSHAIKLSSGQFVVCQISAQPSVYLVNSDGSISGKPYGGYPGRAKGQLLEPRHLAVDSYGNVYVADCGNCRVEVLSPTLEHIRYVFEDGVPGTLGTFPHALHLDEKNNLLYIGSLNGRLVGKLLPSIY